MGSIAMSLLDGHCPLEIVLVVRVPYGWSKGQCGQTPYGEIQTQGSLNTLLNLLTPHLYLDLTLHATLTRFVPGWSLSACTSVLPGP